MKKILFGLVLMVAVLVQAGQLNRISLQNGSTTNGWIMDGTNRLYVLNQVLSTNDLDSVTLIGGVGATNMLNLGLYLRSTKITVPSTSVGVGIGGYSTAATQTNWLIYAFQRSWDGSNWINWTNIAFQPVAQTSQYTNFNLTIGDYQYMRVYNISNTSTSPQSQGWKSNFLEIYYK